VETTSPRRVLGIDPGLTRCGVGVVEGHASRPRLVAHRCLQSDRDLPVAYRLRVLHDALARFVETAAPTAVAVEEVLFSTNVRTAMATAQAAGVAMLVAAEAGLAVTTYTPTQVKLTVAGDGRADKRAVARMVVAQLGLDAAPRPADVSDALAVALTDLAHGRTAARAAAGGAASAALAEAHVAARRAGRGGWEALIAGRAARPSPTGGDRP
jgi:crossover junction endodeoxyribonuclease RuvC